MPQMAVHSVTLDDCIYRRHTGAEAGATILPPATKPLAYPARAGLGMTCG